MLIDWLEGEKQHNTVADFNIGRTKKFKTRSGLLMESYIDHIYYYYIFYRVCTPRIIELMYFSPVTNIWITEDIGWPWMRNEDTFWWIEWINHLKKKEGEIHTVQPVPKENSPKLTITERRTLSFSIQREPSFWIHLCPVKRMPLVARNRKEKIWKRRRAKYIYQKKTVQNLQHVLSVLATS